MAAHSSTLAWKIPWTEEPGRLQSMGSLRAQLSDLTFTFHFHALEKEMATLSSVLAWRIPGTGQPGGLPSMGSQQQQQCQHKSVPFSYILQGITGEVEKLNSPYQSTWACSSGNNCVLYMLHYILLFAIPWTVAHQAPLSTGFSSQEYWHGLPFPPPGDLPDAGIKVVSLASLALQADSLPRATWEAPRNNCTSSWIQRAQCELSCSGRVWCPVNPLLPVSKNFLVTWE